MLTASSTTQLRRQFQHRPALRQRHRTPGHERDAVLLAGVVHLTAQSQRYDRCLSLKIGTKRLLRRMTATLSSKKRLRGIFVHAVLVDGIVAVLADNEDRIDGQFLAAESQGLGDRLTAAQLELPGHALGQVETLFLPGRLIGVNRHDLSGGLHDFAVEKKRRQKVFQNIMGVRPVKTNGVDGRHSGACGSAACVPAPQKRNGALPAARPAAARNCRRLVFVFMMVVSIGRHTVSKSLLPRCEDWCKNPVKKHILRTLHRLARAHP